MNIRSKFLCLILSATPLLFQPVMANECSTVTFTNEISGNKVVELIAINANFINATKAKSKKVINGEAHPYYFESGEYSALVQIWDRSFYNVIKLDTAEQENQARAVKAFKKNRMHRKTIDKDYFENEVILAEFIQEIPLNISIESDTSYSFKLNENNNKIILSNQSDREIKCPTSKRRTFKSKRSYRQVTDALPEQLELRLRRVIDALNQYHKAENLPATNLIPSGAYPYFGAVLSNKKLTSKGYQILSVQPYSLAQKVGLVTGDSITKLGSKVVMGDYVGANDELQKYLASINLNEKIEISIYRDGKERALSRPMSITNIPQSSYAIENNQNSENKSFILSRSIPENLAFEYDQILLELSEHYEKALSHSNIELSRELSFSKKYGMKGKVLSNNDQYTFKITGVEPQLTADIIGLKAGDIIKTVDGKAIENKRWPFGKAVKTLREGQHHKVEIVRNNNEIVLEGQYIHHHWPAFTLKLLSTNKLASISRKKRRMLNYRKIPRRNVHQTANKDSFAKKSTSSGSTGGGTTGTKTKGN